MKESLEEQSRSSSFDRNGRAEAIHRKPLPISPFVDPSLRQHVQYLSEEYRPFSSHVSFSGEQNQVGRHTDGFEHLPRRSLDGSISISRKPVGHIPTNSRWNTPDSGIVERKPVRGHATDENTRQRPRTGLTLENDRSNLALRRPLQRLVDDVGTTSSMDSLHYHAANVTPVQSVAAPQLPPRRSYSNSECEIEQDFQVVIIRRDPTSGSQWNVGSLSRGKSGASTESDSVRVEITTPGYQKFAKKRESRASTLQGYGQHGLGSMNNGSPKHLSTTTETRNLTLEAMAPPSTNFEPMPFARDIVLNRPTKSQRPKSSHHHHHHHRSNSSDTFPTSSSNMTEPISPNPPRQLTFTSPWQGTCTFATGMNGRSLKCRHKLPTRTSDQNDSSVLIADLRFNLPWSALKSRDGNVRDHKRPTSLALLGADAKHGLKKASRKSGANGVLPLPTPRFATPPPRLPRRITSTRPGRALLRVCYRMMIMMMVMVPPPCRNPQATADWTFNSVVSAREEAGRERALSWGNWC